MKVKYILLAFEISVLCLSSKGQGTYIDYDLTPAICTSATGKIEITNIKTTPAPFSFSLDGVNYTSNTTFDSLTSGFYTVYTKDGFGLVGQDFIDLDTTNQIPEMELITQNPTCEFQGGLIEITNILNAVEPYQFFFNDEETTEQTFTELSAGYYQIKVIDGNGCEREQGAELVDQCIVPSQGFSPNGDGINDTWIITRIEQFPDAEIKVFNRYGQIVFRSTGYDVPWEGKSFGMSLPLGTYYYEIKISDGTEEPQVYSGSVVIVK
jgi:gliding motility-associated-like protein